MDVRAKLRRSIPAARRAAAGRCAGLDVAERDAPFAHVVGREFERHLVAREDADVVLAHLAGGVGDQLMAVVQRDAVAGVGQHFADDTAHFDVFFLGHVGRSPHGRGAMRRVRLRPAGCSRPAAPWGQW